MTHRRSMQAGYTLLPSKNGLPVLDWQPHLANQLRAVTDMGRQLTVRFLNTTQRDAWLVNYRVENKK